METIIHTKTVEGAFGFTVEWFREKGDPFRIGTPGTFKGTSFEKNQSAATRSVVNRKTLDVENMTPG